MNGSLRPPDDTTAVDAHKERDVAARAQALAENLHSFRPQTDLPEPLWEAAYLLQEAERPTRPCLERLRILGLMASSLDRFFMQKLLPWQEEMAQSGDDRRPLSALEPLLARASVLLRDQLLPLLATDHAAFLLTPEELSTSGQEWVRSFFHERVYPLLTPLAVDPGHPFPFISSTSLNLLVLLSKQPERKDWRSINYARIKVPRLLSRFVPVPTEEREGIGSIRAFVPSEYIVRFFLTDLFPGLRVESAHLFRVLRAETSPAVGDLPVPRSRQQQLALPVVRVDVEATLPTTLRSWLLDHLDAPVDFCYQTSELLGQLQLVELANVIEGTAESARLFFDPFR